MIFTNKKPVAPTKAGLFDSDCKKIILTTDQLLDGVQAIDDEFLQWFVKNPSCEFVEVEEFTVKVDLLEYKTSYKIIIPSEEPKCTCKRPGDWDCVYCVAVEPKQELFANGERVYLKEDNNVSQVVDDNTKDWSLWERLPKQETLEEAAENYENSFSTANGTESTDFIAGAKWQQERSYSESDKIMKFLDTEIKLGLSDIKTIERVKWYFETYFEQFKKK